MRRFFQLTAIILFFQTSVFGLKVGDEIPLEALTELEIIQGEVPKEWGDKLYIVECWATWCGPCIQVIPHVNELYKKYQSKGLEVIGVNVLDDANKKQVGKFVEKQGEAMSYNVAFASKESIFVKDWFHASGAKGIPYAFIVKNGRLILTTHPGSIDEAFIEALLKPGMSVDDMLAYSNEKEEKIQKIQALGQEFNQALQSNDNAKIGQILESAKSLDVEIHAVLQINYYAYLGDWSALTEFINKSEVDLKSSVSNIFMSTDQMELDPNLLKAMEKHLVLNLPGGTALLKSRLYVRLGDLKKAEAFASEALSEVKLDGEFPTEPFEGFLQAIKNEQPMTLLDLQEAFNK